MGAEAKAEAYKHVQIENTGRVTRFAALTISPRQLGIANRTMRIELLESGYRRVPDPPISSNGEIATGRKKRVGRVQLYKSGG